MASEVSICNRALQKLGAARIQSLTEDNVRARACNANYSELRDAELRKHRWHFSIKRTQLAADTTAPVFGKTNYFTLPTDCLRPLPPRKADVEWVIEGRKIATDWTAPLDLRYISQITDPNTMDATFREALASKLAYELCEEITQSNIKKRANLDDYTTAIAEARKTNATETVSEEGPEDSWVLARSDSIGNMRADNPYA